jgi:gamma-glutamyl:cysteine ligase YbdK (ATP-grasp superfamily)
MARDHRRREVYFDVRPALAAPTLELRVCDSCPSVDTAAGVMEGQTLLFGYHSDHEETNGSSTG